MKEFLSYTDNKILLCILIKNGDVVGDRVDVSPREEFLQMSYQSIPEGKRFRAHKHLNQTRPAKLNYVPQEAWVVLSGKVEFVLFDIDDSPCDVFDLTAGDCVITFRGGHQYTALADDTRIYEFKTGPYQGVEFDKRFIGENDG